MHLKIFKRLHCTLLKHFLFKLIYLILTLSHRLPNFKDDVQTLQSITKQFTICLTPNNLTQVFHDIYLFKDQTCF